LIICALLTYGFSDYEPTDPKIEEGKQMRILIGWVFIGIVSLYIAVNLLFIVADILKGIYGKIKQRFSKNKSENSIERD